MSWQVNDQGFSLKKFKEQYINDLLKKLGEENKSKIHEEFNLRLKENKELLSRCIDPKRINSSLSTGLAMGLIQSGKTSSMEMICNLARDNGYKLIIVLSGTVNSLTKQTKQRLNQSTNGICWKRIYIPGSNDEEQLRRGKGMEDISSDISSSFDTWEDNIFNDEEKRTVFILSMKGVKRLEKLHRLIKTLNERDERLSTIPTLIIDDECDHASLNRRRPSKNDDASLVDLGYPPQFAKFQEDQTIDDYLCENSISAEELVWLNEDQISSIDDLESNQTYQVAPNESATHRRIKFLRKFFRNSSYIGYTATPYANLLIDTWNNLSPNFAKVLNPGSGYTGSKFFFDNIENKSKYVRSINPIEFSKLENHNDYPKSLKKALRCFIIGVADGIKKEHHKKNKSRSMFIHICSEVENIDGDNFLSHQNIIELVNEDLQILKNKLLKFRHSQKEQDFEKILDEFLSQYEDLKKFSSNLINFDKNNIIYFVKAISFIELVEFNAFEKSTIPVIKWYEEGYARILIGGAGLDRGYTVEGLTVSYLLRRASERLDTTLQRARFFGYHKNNLDLFRIFMPITSSNVFSDGSKTEYFLRNDITNYLKDPKNDLVDWPRTFMGGTNASYDLTNPARTGFDMLRRRNQFCHIKGTSMHNISDEGLKKNRDLYYEIKKDAVELTDIFKNFDSRGHFFFEKKLGEVKNIFLDRSRFSTDDVNMFNFIANIIEKMKLEEEPCPIMIMNDKYQNSDEKKRRGRNKEFKIVIESNPDKGPIESKDKIYFTDYLENPDDFNLNELYAKNQPTLQIHNFDVYEQSLNIKPNKILKKNVSYFFFYAPTSWFAEVSPWIGIQKI